MRRSDSTPAWFAVAGVVVVYDVWALRTSRETLTCGWHRALAHPRRRWAVIVLWLWLTVHLHWPGWRWDPLRVLVDRISP